MASLFERMKDRLSKTTDNFKEKITHTLYYRKLDDDFFDELEENLILSDMGIETSVEIVDKLKERIRQEGTMNSDQAIDLLKSIMTEMVSVEKKEMNNCCLLGISKAAMK